LTSGWRVCPECGDWQHVHKVSSVRAHIVSKRRPVSAEVAEALAPPSGPTLRHFPRWLTILGVLVVLISGTVLAWQLAGTKFDLREPAAMQPAGLPWSVVGLLAGLLILLANPIYRAAERVRLAAAEDRWWRAKQRWDRLYYCQACAGVFDPSEGRVVPVERMSDYLYGGTDR
jgi:hypothetical protein